jgi:circadian clock protein KaiB
MAKGRIDQTTRAFEQALAGTNNAAYVLRLFVTGMTPRSARAIANVKKVCDKYLRAQYELEVIDLYQNPQLAQSEQIIAAPTLIRKLPLPLRRIIGDLSNTERVLVGLDLQRKG